MGGAPVIGALVVLGCLGPGIALTLYALWTAHRQ